MDIKPKWQIRTVEKLLNRFTPKNKKDYEKPLHWMGPIVINFKMKIKSNYF